jgi:uncharacterized membrane protein YphA (DoxX/SURF4 family)
MTSARKRSVSRQPGPAGAADRRGAGYGTSEGLAASAVAQLGRLTANWATTVGRVLLGLVLAWFGYHELVQPAIWTGYVPGVHSSSAAAVALVLAHGWVLLILAVALLAGIATRAAACLAALLLAEIVIWLWASAGLSDLTMRDVGVLGLAACLAGRTEQRFALTG